MFTTKNNPTFASEMRDYRDTSNLLSPVENIYFFYHERTANQMFVKSIYLILCLHNYRS